VQKVPDLSVPALTVPAQQAWTGSAPAAAESD